MTEDDLGDLGRVRGEDPKRVVPETAGQDEPGVQGDHEAVRLHADPLAEIVTQVTPNLNRKRLRKHQRGKFNCIKIYN